LDRDIVKIKDLARNTKVITTEKDFVRIKNKFDDNLFYLPIISVIDDQSFNEIIFKALNN